MKRATTVVAAVSGILLVVGVSSAAAASVRETAARAVAKRMILAPRSEAMVKGAPVRVVVRVPARTGRLRVHVGDRDVTDAFRRAGGSKRVAALTRSDGLRYGANHLSVLAERRGRRPVAEARSFVLARRDYGLVRLRVRPGPVTALDMRVARPRLKAEHFGQAGKVKRRLSAIRRERVLRVRLNGRQVTRAVHRSRPRHWKASFSASHGLRYGVNRLRILVAEPDRGRYALLRRRFVVHRDSHLAAAGWNRGMRVGGRVRLNGRSSRAVRGGQLEHRWRIVSKPRGSDPKLRHAGSARPLLTPDRRGRYVVRLKVTGRTGRAPAGRLRPTAGEAGPTPAQVGPSSTDTAGEAGRSSTDTVTVTAGPAELLVPFTGLTVKDGHPGIQVGDKFYPNPSPNGSAMQWLTLDRATLTPTQTGNSWFDGSARGDHGLAKLASALTSSNIDQLVILSYPYAGGPGPPVDKDQIGAFNDAMKTLGVGPIDAGILQDHNKLVIVGIPKAGAGSGWYTHGGGPVDALTGWLMPEAVKVNAGYRFRLQPERPEFDTSSSRTPTTNTMLIRDQRVTASLPAGQNGGFQVVELNPIDFRVVKSDAFGANGGLEAMATRLNEIRDHGTGFVAVQSIGNAGGWNSVDSVRWEAVGSALAGFGANPHTFNTVNVSYAFIGGRQLARSEVADSSSAIVIDPTENPPTHESGTLRGRLTMRHDGYWKPTVADPSASLEFSLYDMVFSSPTPWPYTAGGAFPQQKNCPAPGNDTAAYRAALSYIAGGIHLPAYQSDVRSAYVARQQENWVKDKQDLGGLSFESGHGFGEAEFCNLSAQLQLEFDWLDNVKQLFDAYEQVFESSGNEELANLETIGDNIRKGIKPDNGAEVGWSVGAFAGNLTSAVLIMVPEGEAVLAAWEGLMTVYELVRELGGGPNGIPVGDQVTSKVRELSHKVATQLADAGDGLVRLRDVIYSDYGRLRAVGSADLSLDTTTTKHNITAAASAFFSSQLVPIPYGVHAMFDKDIRPEDRERPWDPTQFKCEDPSYGPIWDGVPASAQVTWMADVARDGYHDWLHRGVGTIFTLGRHRLSAGEKAYPPAAVVDPMFTPITQRTAAGDPGYGMRLPRFVWEQYEAVHKAPPTDIALCVPPGGVPPPGPR